MTPLVHGFIKQHKDKLVGKVLEVGSFNVNGSVRDIVSVNIGIDMRKGNGVDLVLPAEDLLLEFPESYFDSLVTTETIEHIEHWKEALTAMSKVVKPGGWWVATMASLSKRYHAYPHDYVRFNADQLNKIFPGCEVVDLGISIGWVWQNGNLDLDVRPYKPRK
jgi:hypothetical protein